MRQSDIRLTLQTYTDPKLINTVGALDALSQLSTDTVPQEIRATGTEGQSMKTLGPQLGPKGLIRERSRASVRTGRGTEGRKRGNSQLHFPATFSTQSQGHSSKRAIGFEPTTSSLGKSVGKSWKSSGNPVLFSILASKATFARRRMASRFFAS